MQSWQQIAEKLELCVQKLELCAQKIFEAFLAYGNQQNSAFFVIRAKKPHINMLMKLTPVANVIKLFLSVIYVFLY